MKPSHDKESRLTAETLRSLMIYSPDTGEFRWLARPDVSRANRIFNSKYAGERAGVLSPRGYRYIRIRGLDGFFTEGRLAWLYMTGAWPTHEIDHINGDPSDNRLKNLRHATRSENAANRLMHKNNQSGFKGVTKKRNKWEAAVRIRNKRFRLGSFDSPQEAYAAYAGAAKVLQGEFAKV